MTKASDPSLLYATLILPSLFSLTLMFEGIHKYLNKQSGWAPLFMGCMFLVATIAGYYFIQ